MFVETLTERGVKIPRKDDRLTRPVAAAHNSAVTLAATSPAEVSCSLSRPALGASYVNVMAKPATPILDQRLKAASSARERTPSLA